jgi:hypothetical protein
MSKKLAVIFILALAAGLVFSRLRSEPKVENQSRTMLASEINEWYWRRSIERKSFKEYRSADDKEVRENLRKVIHGLSDEWRLLSEDIEVKEVDYASRIVDTTEWFENPKTKERRLFKDRYYYDLATDEPVPLLTELVLFESGKARQADGFPKTLWAGDFDAICVKPNQ